MDWFELINNPLLAFFAGFALSATGAYIGLVTSIVGLKKEVSAFRETVSQHFILRDQKIDMLENTVEQTTERQEELNSRFYDTRQEVGILKAKIES